MKALKTIVALWVMVACMHVVGFAFDSNEAKQAFTDANALYKESKYDKAITKYETIVNTGFSSGNLYYNLGNCYFKKGELGKALLNYERAKVTLPNDGDIKSNEEYVRSLLEGQAGQVVGNRIERVIVRIFSGFTVDGLTIFLSCLYWFAIIMLIIRLFFAPLKKFAHAAIAVFLILGSLSVFALGKRIEHIRSGAVIIEKSAEARFEPNESATTFFKLSEGDFVSIIEKSDGWYKVKRPDGKIGWLPVGALDSIQR